MLKLWTVRPLDDYELLEKQGFLITNPQWVADDHLDAYTYMAQHLQARCQAPAGVIFPLWAWYRAHGKQKPKPDLRQSGFLEKGQKGVRIGFEMPAADVLLSNFDAWHAVLNDHCLAFSDAQYEAFEALEQRLPAAEFAKLKRKTWQQIFDLDLLSQPETDAVQAVFWQLKWEALLEVDFFTAR